MEQSTLRTKSILVSTLDHTEWFQSKEDLPAPIRKRMESALNSPNSFTFLLADRNGRDELVKALGGESSPLTPRYSLKNSAKGLPNKVTLSEPDTRSFDGTSIATTIRRMIIAFSLVLAFTLFLIGTKILSY